MSPLQTSVSPLPAWNAVELAEFDLGATLVLGIWAIVLCVGWRLAKKEQVKRARMRAELAARKLEQEKNTDT